MSMGQEIKGLPPQKRYMVEAANNKHKLVLMFLYYAGLRLDEARNL